MNVNEIYPSKYIKSSDLGGRKLKLRISEVRLEKLGQDQNSDQKLVIYFDGKQKGLVMNKTKSGVLASAWSPETNGWIGKSVFVYPTKVNFQGQMVDSIGIEPDLPVVDGFDDDKVPDNF